MARPFGGVICKNKACGAGIELGEYHPIGGKTVEWKNPLRRERIPCPKCGQEFEYKGNDFEVYED